MEIQNGTYTLINDQTGEHRTFKIETQPLDAKFRPGERILSLMTGTDNEHDFTGFAFVTSNGIRLWKKFLSQDPTKPSFHEKCARALWTLALGESFGPLRIELEKRCMICNRKLTNPESLENGIGPECIKRVGDFKKL